METDYKVAFDIIHTSFRHQIDYIRQRMLKESKCVIHPEGFRVIRCFYGCYPKEIFGLPIIISQDIGENELIVTIDYSQ